jgi:hypothetical protein
MRVQFAFFRVLAVLSTFCCGQAQPGWFGKAPALAVPSGAVVRVSTAERILVAAEMLAPGNTLLIEPGTYKLPWPLVLRGRTNITIRSVSGEPASVTLTAKGGVKGMTMTISCTLRIVMVW